jgi:gliding motility-associated lipoprotein GldH
VWLFLCGGCGEGDTRVLYANFRSIAGEAWERDSVVAFTVDVPRPGRYAFTLYARYTIDVRQANVALLVTVSRPGVPPVEERVEMRVADDEAGWTGRGSVLKTLAFPLPARHWLDSAGVYRVEIRHRMKERKIKGIKDIGIQIHGEK